MTSIVERVGHQDDTVSMRSEWPPRQLFCLALSVLEWHLVVFRNRCLQLRRPRKGLHQAEERSVRSWWFHHTIHCRQVLGYPRLRQPQPEVTRCSDRFRELAIWMDSLAGKSGKNLASRTCAVKHPNLKTSLRCKKTWLTVKSKLRFKRCTFNFLRSGKKARCALLFFQSCIHGCWDLFLFLFSLIDSNWVTLLVAMFTDVLSPLMDLLGRHKVWTPC